MKIALVLGVAFLVLGIVALGYEGITYFTKEKVVDAGPLEITVEKKKTLPLSPIVGIASLLVGLSLIWMGLERGRPA